MFDYVLAPIDQKKKLCASTYIGHAHDQSLHQTHKN